MPFLIDNYATQSKVLLGPIGRQLTRDMSKAGVTGLALIPDHLSYLVTTAPIDSPDDLAGKRMRAFGRSRSQAAAFRALGATPVPLNGTTVKAAAEMKKHHLFGIESNPLIWSEVAYAGSTYTLGAPIWPRTAALFAAPDRFARLPDATQQLLRSRRRARRTRSRPGARRPTTPGPSSRSAGSEAASRSSTRASATRWSRPASMRWTTCPPTPRRRIWSPRSSR